MRLSKPKTPLYYRSLSTIALPPAVSWSGVTVALHMKDSLTSRPASFSSKQHIKDGATIQVGRADRRGPSTVSRLLINLPKTPGFWILLSVAPTFTWSERPRTGCPLTIGKNPIHLSRTTALRLLWRPGLLELSLAVTEPSKADYYRKYAFVILNTLLSPEFLANETPGWEGILKHGTYHERKKLGVDESVMWGEYFFLSALDKALRLAE